MKLATQGDEGVRKNVLTFQAIVLQSDRDLQILDKKSKKSRT
jgi:hypothetical protein